MTREKLLIAVNEMPENFHIDELIQKLIVIEKINQARKNVKDGDVYTNDEVKERINQLKNGRVNLV